MVTLLLAVQPVLSFPRGLSKIKIAESPRGPSCLRIQDLLRQLVSCNLHRALAACMSSSKSDRTERM